MIRLCVAEPTELKVGVMIGCGRYSFVKLNKIKNRLIAEKYMVCSNEINSKLFQSEISVLKRLNPHQNIVRYIGSEKRDVFYILKLGLCEKGPLRELIDESKFIYSMRTALWWAEQLFSALCFLKKMGVIHRDVTPRNILLDKNFILKLADFGFVRDLGTQSSNKQTGTYRYMSPEAYYSELQDQVSCQSDLYAAGLVLWEILERRTIFTEYHHHPDGFDHDRLFADLKRGTLEFLAPKCEHQIGNVVTRCVKYDLNERPLAEDLHRIIEEMNINLMNLDKQPKFRAEQKKRLKPIGYDGTMKEIVLEEDEVALSELGFDSFTPTPVVSMINGKVVEKELVLIEMTSKVIQESEDKVRKTSSVKSKSQTLHKGVRDIEIARLSVENEIEKTLPPDPMPTVASPEVKETRTSTVTALKNRFETAPEEALIVNTSVLALATDLEPPGRIIGKIIQEHSRSTSKNRESIGMLLATPAQLQILSTTGDKDIGSLSSINRVFSPIPADPSVIQPIETSRNEYFPVVEILVAPPEPPIDYMNKENAEIENPGNLGKPQEHQLVTNSDFKNNKFSMSKTDSKINPAALYDVGCQAASITLQPSLPELVTTSSVVHDSQISQSNSTRTTIAQSVNTESTLTNTSVGYRSIDPKRLEKMQKADREVQKSFKRSAIRQLNQLEDKYSKEKEAYRINSKKRLKEMEDNKLMEFEDERRKQRKAYKIVQAKLKLKEEREMAEFRSIEAVQLKKIENRVKNLPKSMQKETLNARKSQLKRERREEEQRFIQRLKRKIDLIMRKLAETDQNAISKIEQKYVTKMGKQKKRDKEIEAKRIERMRKDKFDLNVKLFKIKWEMLEAQLDCAQHEEVKRLEKVEKKQMKRMKIPMFFNFFRQSSKSRELEENLMSELQELKERHRLEKREFEKKKNQKLDQLYETQKSGDNFSLFDDSDEETIVENDYATLSQRSLNTWRL